VSHEVHDEDQIILAALAALDVDLGTDSGEIELPRGDETQETLTRLYVEALGLLPYSLEPAVPAPAVRQRLMAIVQGDETQEVDPVTAAVPPPVAMPPVSAASAVRESQGPQREDSRPDLRESQAVSALSAPSAPMAPVAPIESRRRPRRWPLALAASLALLFLGVSAFFGWGLVDQDRKMEALRAQNEALRQESDEMRQRVGALETQLVEMRGSMSLVTTPGVEVASMRPVAESGAPVPPEAGGLLFIAPDHQHWHLSVRGLQPAEQGRRYHLWFIGESGAYSGGSFDAKPGSPMELSSEHMPTDTREILITVEDLDAAQPSGPPVLRATPPIKII
jgi:hypothetical protein